MIAEACSLGGRCHTNGDGDKKQEQEEEEVMSMSIDEIDAAYSPGGEWADGNECMRMGMNVCGGAMLFYFRTYSSSCNQRPPSVGCSQRWDAVMLYKQPKTV